MGDRTNINDALSDKTYLAHQQAGRLTAIQLCSKPDVDENLNQIENILASIIEQYPHDENHIVVLPECCLYFGAKDITQQKIAEPLGIGKMQQGLQHLAQTYGVYLLAGSLPLYIDNEDKRKFSATSVLFSPQGERLAYYQKMHLFDVNINDNEKSYRESLTTHAGNKVINHRFGSINLGFSICYDLRFPELYRALQQNGCNVVAVPSAFTQITGSAHWESLLRARAIENQVYIVAANQQGIHQNGRQTFGHSMIISPWGKILALKEQGEGFISAEFDAQLIQQIRSDIPVSIHNKFSVLLNQTRN